MDEGLVFWSVGANAIGVVMHIGKSFEVEYYKEALPIYSKAHFWVQEEKTLFLVLVHTTYK